MTEPAGVSSRMAAPGSTATRLLVPMSVVRVMSNVLVFESDSGGVGLGEVGARLAGGQPLAQPGDGPQAGQDDQPQEHEAVAGELRQEDQRRADAGEDDEADDVDRHPRPAQVEGARLGGGDGAAAVSDDQGDGL